MQICNFGKEVKYAGKNAAFFAEPYLEPAVRRFFVVHTVHTQPDRSMDAGESEISVVPDLNPVVQKNRGRAYVDRVDKRDR